MLHIAICDDQPDQIRSIRQSSERYFQDKQDTVSYETFDNAFSFVDTINQGAIFDIVLLDVCMPGILGTEVAQELRKFSSSTEIIFLTTSDEFAMDAFAVKATDYLLKPFTQSQFNQAMDRAIAFIRQRSSAKIMLRLVGGGLCIEEISQILYFESHGHILQVHLADGTVLETRKSGQEIKDELDKIASGQFSPHRTKAISSTWQPSTSSRRITWRLQGKSSRSASASTGCSRNSISDSCSHRLRSDASASRGTWR